MSETPYPVNEEETLIFTFISKGPKGNINKLVRYDQINERVYNLGFGDRIENSYDFDDQVVTDNGDIRKVLTTVIHTLEFFFLEFPDKLVHIKGSDATRTGLYFWLIRNNRRLFEEKYEFWGGKGNEYEPFRENFAYEYVLISKKKEL